MLFIGCCQVAIFQKNQLVWQLWLEYDLFSASLGSRQVPASCLVPTHYVHRYTVVSAGCRPSYSPLPYM